jgi:hypothetical protein
MLFATYSWFFLAPGYTVRVSYPVVGAQTANERSRGLPLAGDVMRRLLHRQGHADRQPADRQSSPHPLRCSMPGCEFRQCVS